MRRLTWELALVVKYFHVGATGLGSGMLEMRNLTMASQRCVYASWLGTV